jgi:BCD family chlorophyll transporter-like MFS transporter
VSAGAAPDLGWGGIARLGLVQASLGAIVVLTTSTLNRVMVVELALPALLPGILVALHYLVQVARPRMGHGSDVGGRRTPWILGGMALLGVGGVLAAAATAWMATQPAAGMALSVLAFAMVGLGVSASGTSLLVLLAKRVAPHRRAPAATIVWMMMILGFALTAGIAGKLLDPYSPARLVAVSAGVSVLAFLLTVVALFRLEGHTSAVVATEVEANPGFRAALSQVWGEPAARQFTIFVFISMLAYSAQDLILEPFAGTVFGYSPGASTQLSGVQHGGVLLGMIVVALAGSGTLGRLVGRRGGRMGSLKAWSVGGCLASAIALVGLFMAGITGPGWPLAATVFLLGAANGAFSIAAIGSMMQLAGQGRERREGVRMGLWGAAQAVAFGLGGLLGTAASDIARWLIASPGSAYAAVFLFEALLFVVAAWLALQIGAPANNPSSSKSAASSPRGDSIQPRGEPWAARMQQRGTP